MRLKHSTRDYKYVRTEKAATTKTGAQQKKCQGVTVNVNKYFWTINNRIYLYVLEGLIHRDRCVSFNEFMGDSPVD